MSINFFEHQKTIAKNLLTFIRVKGHSKLSLSKLTGISRPTIDQLLKGESPSQTTYNGQIAKINQTFELPDDYFITAQSTPSLTHPLAYAYSDHRVGMEKSEKAKELLEGLDNVLDIYSMYV
ncbi:helix-turn-helix domain-containing protein [Brevibacillus fluminis]|uniref:helix-turn-helix domain-containing protein n=1 Tax=Brevibacillus fluminis TaxID=511487 RepID=UPI003F8CE403